LRAPSTFFPDFFIIYLFTPNPQSGEGCDPLAPLTP